MVSTRHHPNEFPEPSTPTSTMTSPTPSSSSPPPPAKSKPKSSTASPSKASSTSASTSALAPPSPSKRRTPSSTLAKSSTSAAATASSSSYTHQPPVPLLLWLLASLPLVLWDTGYVVLRPHSMPGGFLHAPLWTPYALYGKIDYIYGWPAWNGGVGFTAAQGTLNAIELAMCLFYLSVMWMARTPREAGWRAWLVEGKVKAKGSLVATAVVVVWASMVMTISKTVLYWLNEAFSNFDNIGHNDWSTLILLWIIPNGAWIVFPAWMIYLLSDEIVGAMQGKRKAR